MSKVIASALALLLAPSLFAPGLTTSADASPLHDQAGPYELQVLIDGYPAQTYNQNGESYVLGVRGARYTLRLQNNSGQRIEAVVSVDGRDVIDGKSADYQHKRGYLVGPYSQVDIDGWRLSNNQAAAFRFSSVASSYAARSGSPREVGVVGVAVFPERIEPPYRVYVPSPRRPYLDNDDRAYGGPPAAAQAPAREESKKSAADAAAPSMSPPPPPHGGAYGYGDSALGRSERAPQRPGLGTGFGERVDSAVQEVAFVRQSAGQPSALLGLRYNDRSGLLAMGIDVDGTGSYFETEAQRRRTAVPFPSNQNRFATPPANWEDR
jgi:hypothetical protein